MNPFADLPPWIALLVALFAGAVLIALNLGWLMAAKSMLDGQRRKQRERSGAASEAAPRVGERPSVPSHREGRDDDSRTTP
jgi:hypothetical protein